MTDMPVQRFIADTMLGKLVKWLRVMGIDVVYDPAATNDQRLCSTARDGRILLTRDRRLAWRQKSAASAGCLFIESDYYHEQVRQVVQIFALQQSIQMFTRCLRCNRLLQTVNREDAIGKVPSYVSTTQTTFKHCAACNQFYWAGTHRDNMLRQLQVMLGNTLLSSVHDLTLQSKDCHRKV
jgi:uncharacterized protein with PIN domain